MTTFSARESGMGFKTSRKHLTTTVAVVAAFAVAGCDMAGIDYDMRDDLFGSFSTSTGTVTVQPRPSPDANGVISYDDYQVVVARSGDTALSIGSRLGISGTELARFNGLQPDAPLRPGELLALPTRVAATPAAPVAGTANITTLAGDAIERSELPDSQSGATAQATAGTQPLQHRVQPGETAYSIARLYGVSVRALADWNALGADLAVRDNQVLMIPVATQAAEEDTRTAAVATTTAPGQGTATPVPPSASQPLPPPEPAAVAPESPAMDQFQTAASDTASFAMPVTGSIIRSYDKGRNDGIGIAADAGAPVRAANSGEVAAITRDTDQVPILVLRHSDNLLTVYANVGDIKVEKGDKVSRGEQIAAVAPGNPSFLHFEIREGIESVDPLDYLQ
ncbi:MAG: peptidoglycan DD-metalloendopeptidase family protein [Dinoroseobacter sp.]|nr:peptidoglycan DD-metalloendopeptidase family protein [Dinoroseobacter sp.]MDJ0994105.1 peptidoglycan DD-metalloendopeptidase family protein [Dinoroseobacter sp.]